MQFARSFEGLHVLGWPGMTAVLTSLAAFMFSWWRTTPAIWAGAIAWSLLVVIMYVLGLLGSFASARSESWLFWCLALPAATWFTYEQLRFLRVVTRENRALPASHYRPNG